MHRRKRGTRRDACIMGGLWLRLLDGHMYAMTRIMTLRCVVMLTSAFSNTFRTSKTDIVILCSNADYVQRTISSYARCAAFPTIAKPRGRLFLVVMIKTTEHVDVGKGPRAALTCLPAPFCRSTKARATSGAESASGKYVRWKIRRADDGAWGEPTRQKTRSLLRQLPRELGFR